MCDQGEHDVPTSGESQIWAIRVRDLLIGTGCAGSRLGMVRPRSQQPPGYATNKNPESKRYEDVELVGEIPVRKREGRVTYNG